MNTQLSLSRLWTSLLCPFWAAWHPFVEWLHPEARWGWRYLSLLICSLVVIKELPRTKLPYANYAILHPKLEERQRLSPCTKHTLNTIILYIRCKQCVVFINGGSTDGTLNRVLSVKVECEIRSSSCAMEISRQYLATMQFVGRFQWMEVDYYRHWWSPVPYLEIYTILWP